MRSRETNRVPKEADKPNSYFSREGRRAQGSASQTGERWSHATASSHGGGGVSPAPRWQGEDAKGRDECQLGSHMANLKGLTEFPYDLTFPRKYLQVQEHGHKEIDTSRDGTRRCGHTPETHHPNCARETPARWRRAPSSSQCFAWASSLLFQEAVGMHMASQCKKNPKNKAVLSSFQGKRCFHRL